METADLIRALGVSGLLRTARRLRDTRRLSCRAGRLAALGCLGRLGRLAVGCAARRLGRLPRPVRLELVALISRELACACIGHTCSQ